MTYRSFTHFLILLFAHTSIAQAAGESPLSPREVVQRGKDTTALVMRPGASTSGTATCVHPNGYFVCSSESLAAVGRDQIELVQRTGGNELLRSPATLVRYSPDGVYALLKASYPSGETYPALQASSIDPGSPGPSVRAFGFPHIRTKNGKKSVFPIHITHVVRMAELNTVGHKDAPSEWVLERMKTSPGILGGPVLDSEGGLVGVLGRSKVRYGYRVAPVRDILSWVTLPVIESIDWQRVKESPSSVVYRATVRVDTLDASKPLNLRVELEDVYGFKSRVPLKRMGSGKTYAGDLTVPRWTSEEQPVQIVTREMGRDERVHVIKDALLRVGDSSRKWSDLRYCRVASMPHAVLADGIQLFGKLNPKSALVREWTSKGPADELDLSGATRITAYPLPQRDHLRYRVMGTWGKDPIQDVVGHCGVDGQPRPGRKEIALPGHAAAAVLGAKGRLLFLHIPEKAELVIFDIRSRALTKQIRMRSTTVILAAGEEKLVIGYPKLDQVDVCDLDGTVEHTVFTRDDGLLLDIGLGHSSSGPAVLRFSSREQYENQRKYSLKALSLRSGEISDLPGVSSGVGYGPLEGGGLSSRKMADGYSSETHQIMFSSKCAMPRSLPGFPIAMAWNGLFSIDRRC